MPVSVMEPTRTFAQLLEGHLRQGTRPQGSPNQPSKAWTAKAFAAAIGNEDRTVRNWIAGRTKPSLQLLIEIEQALFGDNPAYDAWRTELREAHARARAGSSPQADPSPSAPARKPCHLPFTSLGSLFKGREGFIARLQAALAPDDAGHTHAIAVSGRAVHGLGGIGKTRLAVEYAWQQREAHTATLFVPADTPERLSTGLAALAAREILNLPEGAAREDEAKVAAVLTWLADHPGWLLILDNVDNELAAAAVTALLQRLNTAGARGQVLVTGRLSSYPPGIDTLELDVLAPDAAAAYLLEATASKRRPHADDEALARELAGELDGLALGLSQAAAFINARRIGLAHYLELWRSKREQVLGWFDPGLVSYNHDVGLAATWTTSVEELLPAARRLLEQLAFLDPAPVPDSLLDVAVPAEGDEADDEDSADDQPRSDGAAALEELFTYSLATRVQAEGEGDDATDLSFTVHRLVQDYTRRSMDAVRRAEALAESLRWIDNAFAGNPQDVRSWPVLDPLMPHALAVVWAADEARLAEPTTRVLNQLGMLFTAKARWAEAELLYQRAVAIDEANLGADHPDVATRVSNLSILLIETNRYAQAEPLIRRALTISEASLGPDHPTVAVHLNVLAGVLFETNRPAEAEPLFRRALSINEASFGPDHPTIANRLSNLAGLLLSTNRHAEAETLIRRAVSIGEASFGPDHPNVAISLNILSGLLLDTNRHAEAELLLRRALAITEASFGPDHPDVAIRLNSLARVLLWTKRHAEAEPLTRRALSIGEASFGPDHPVVASCIETLAAVLRVAGRHSEAEQLIRRTGARTK